MCVCKKRHLCKKYYIWNPATCICGNVNYLASIMDDSVITGDEIIDAETKWNDEEAKTAPTNLHEKKPINYYSNIKSS